MRYSDWKPFYEQIKNELNLNFEKDKDASLMLDSLLENKKKPDLKTLENLIKNKEVIVFGAAPSLEKSIIKYKEKINDSIKITADGATSALIKAGIKPDIIVSDLDGYILDQIDVNFNGGIILIHAHGDNIESLKKHVKNFQGNIIGTTQIDPSDFKNLYNFGGFTDGDRAVFLADYFKAKKIFLIGFDFNQGIGKYSFPEKKDVKNKIKKLKWSEKLIKEAIKQNKNIIFL